MNKYFLSFIYIFCIFLCNTSNLTSGEKVKYSLGFGMPELINVGARFPLPHSEIGLSIGLLPFPVGNVYSFSGDLYMYLTKDTNFTVRIPWYVKLGLNYQQYEKEDEFLENIDANIRIGRDFFLTDMTGLQFYVGISLEVTGEPMIFIPDMGHPLHNPILPSYGFSFFLKL